MNRQLLLFKSLDIFASCISKCNISSATAAVTKIHRSTYNRTYPTLLVFPNGATVQIRYPEPRMILKLPLDISFLSEDEKRLHLLKKKPKQKVVMVEEEKISYDPSKYINLIRKNRECFDKYGLPVNGVGNIVDDYFEFDIL